MLRLEKIPCSPTLTKASGESKSFARKKYVQRQTAPIRDRVNELDELTSQNTS